MSIFSKNLRFLREQKGLNLDNFECFGIKKGTMSNYELGKTEPKFSTLMELSNFFRVQIDDFLTKDLSLHDELIDLEIDNSDQAKKEEIKEISFWGNNESIFNPNNSRITYEKDERASIYYEMYKEKDAETRKLSEEIGALKNEIENLKEEITLIRTSLQCSSNVEFVQDACAKGK